MNNPLFSQKR